MVEIEYQKIEKQEAYEEIIARVVKKVLEEEKIKKEVFVSVTLTNNEEIKEINAAYRKIDRATDVLSFPMFEREEVESLKVDAKEDEPDIILGDLVISIPKVEEQAKEYGHAFKRELAYLVTHGMLHLLGYDHIIEEEQKEMRKREEEILNLLEITRE